MLEITGRKLTCTRIRERNSKISTGLPLQEQQFLPLQLVQTKCHLGKIRAGRVDTRKNKQRGGYLAIILLYTSDS
jgi:hypothetical protein